MTDTFQGDSGGEVTEEAIRRRAHEISERDDSGTPEENWQRAERELRGARAEEGS